MKTERIELRGEIKAEAPSSSDGASESTDGKKAKRWLNISAYSGDKVDLAYWNYPVVIDLARLDTGRGRHPILMKHDPDRIVGYCVEIENNGRELKMKAAVVNTPDAKHVIDLADDDYPWQASVGADPVEAQFVEQGQSAMINGRNFSGPFYNVAARLRETSVLTLGADCKTEVLAASRATPEAPVREERKMSNPDAEAIKAEFKDDPAYALDAIMAGKTLVEAQAGYLTKIRAHLIEASKPPAKAPEASTPVRAEASERSPQAQDPMVEFRKLVAGFEAKGMSRDNALSAAANANRDLHQSVIKAANVGR